MKYLFNILLIAFLAVLIKPDTTISIIPATLTNVNLTSYTYQYFSLNIPANTNKKVLLITVTSNFYTYISMYISLNDQLTLPNSTQYTDACFYSSLDTCSINIGFALPKTVYFSVIASQTGMYQIEASFHDIYPLAINNYEINFTNFESAIGNLPPSQFANNQPIIFLAQYKTFENQGKFQMFASKNGTKTVEYSGNSMGAYRRFMKLPPPSSNESYDIIFQALEGTNLQLYVYQSTSSLSINNTYVDLINDQTTYTLNNQLTQTPNSQLFISLSSYSGYGIFYVDYCNGQSNYTYQNINGYNGEIVISIQEREQCYNTNKSLLFQNIQFTIDKVTWQFAFQIGISQGNWAIELDELSSQYGVMPPTIKTRQYIIDIPTTKQMHIKCSTINGDLTYLLKQCTNTKTSTCNTTNLTQDSIRSIQQDLQYFLIINHNDNKTAQFVVEIQPYPISTRVIQPGKVYNSTIQFNQYQFYFINTTHVGPSQSTLLSLFLTTINGQTSMLTSPTQPQPTFDIYLNSSDVIYSWNGQATYQITQNISGIYIGIKGDSQSLYNLQAIIDTDADLPSRYRQLIEDSSNDFILNDNNSIAYIAYASHNIPYKIVFDPLPQCVKYATTLPLSQQCQQLPQLLYDNVIYLQVSQTSRQPKSTFKFTAYVNAGDYSLQPDSPIYISCQSKCYELIHVTIAKDVSIIHNGDGSISIIGQQATPVNNSILTLKCSQPPCQYTLNASIEQSGQMHVTYESNQQSEIEWKTKSMSWNSLPKHLYYKVPKYTDHNSFMIFSGGLTPSIYYNIYAINDNYSNLINYQYPTNNNYSYVVPTHPSLKLQIVTINQSIIKQLGCNNYKTYCIVTVSVYINKSVEYDQVYELKGTSYYSSNTYEEYLSYNYPYLMNKKYSLDYFRSQSNFSYSKISVVPLSNCRPQIITNTTSYIDTLLTNHNNSIRFSILSDQVCSYYALLTQWPIKTLIPNIIYHLQLNNQSNSFNTTFAFTKIYNKQLTITIQNTIANSIIVKKIMKNILQLPTPINNDFIASNTNQLTISGQQTEVESYITTIITKQQKYINVMVENKQQTIKVLHNQEQSIKYTAVNQRTIYQYYTSSDFMISMLISTGKVKIQILTNTNNEVLNQQFTNSSNPQIQVNYTIDTIYFTIIIQCLDVGTSNAPLQLKFHAEQIGTKGNTQLYEGIMQLDAFTRLSSTNCYSYAAPILLGKNNLQIDMTFNITTLIDSIKLSVISPSVITSPNLEMTSPNTFRFKIPFVPMTKYSFCYTLNNLNLVGEQYYIIVVADTDHLASGQTIFKDSANLYQTFQVVNPHNEPMTQFVRLTNCIGRTDVFTSSSYEQSLYGRFTHSHDYWTDSDTILTLSNVNEGYQYLSLKAVLNSSYELYNQWVPNNSKLLSSEWNLIDKKIFKIHEDKPNNLLIIQLPKLVSNGNIPQFCHIKYSLYIHHLQPKPKYLTTTLPKCPSLFNSTTYKMLNITLTKANQTPTFKLDISTLPKQFNISAKAQLNLMESNFSYPYYYSSQYIALTDETWWSNFSSMIKPLLVILSAGCIIFFISFIVIIYRRWTLLRRQSQVAFQMAPFNAQNPNPPPLPSDDRSSNRRALNQNVGYGQFVDESQ